MWGQLISGLHILYVCLSFSRLWFQNTREYALIFPISPILERGFGCNHAAIHYLEILLDGTASNLQKVCLSEVDFIYILKI